MSKRKKLYLPFYIPGFDQALNFLSIEILEASIFAEEVSFWPENFWNEVEGSIVESKEAIRQYLQVLKANDVHGMIFSQICKGLKKFIAVVPPLIQEESRNLTASCLSRPDH